MIFEFKQYDKTLIEFEIVHKQVEGVQCRIISVDKDNENLLPYGMTVSNEGIMSWLKKRVIPKSRAYVEPILSRCGLSVNDTISIIKVCKGLSLNDCYWVVSQGFNGKFKDYNLYENGFDRNLTAIAFTGYGKWIEKPFISSPEFTTNGTLCKCWRRLNKKIYLYKGGTSGTANTGNEPYSEFYATQIAERMGLRHVSYGLAKWKGKFALPVSSLLT